MAYAWLISQDVREARINDQLHPGKEKKIKDADVAKGVNVLTKQRSQTIEDVEKLLLVWINEQQLAEDSVSEVIIYEKVRLLHANFAKKIPGTSSAVSELRPAEAGSTNSRSKLA